MVGHRMAELDAGQTITTIRGLWLMTQRNRPMRALASCFLRQEKLAGEKSTAAGFAPPAKSICRGMHDITDFSGVRAGRSSRPRYL